MPATASMTKEDFYNETYIKVLLSDYGQLETAKQTIKAKITSPLINQNNVMHMICVLMPVGGEVGLWAAEAVDSCKQSN